MDLEQIDGKLIAEVGSTAWLSNLPDAVRHTVTAALVGLFVLSGVEWVRVRDDRRGTVRLIPFARVAVPWREWVETWESKGGTRLPPLELDHELGILPEAARDDACESSPACP
jgi:hypothetical protein